MSKERTDYDLVKRIGKRIAAVRVRAGMSQAEAAERAGVAPVSLSRWETGSRAPSVTMLFKLSQALGVRIGDLVDGDLEQDETADPDLDAVLAMATQEERDLVTRIAIEVLRGKRTERS